MEKKSTYNILVVLATCIGSLTYGYSISSLSSALGKTDFLVYIGLATATTGYVDAIEATANCILYIGGVFGCAAYSFVSNRWGRKAPIQLGCAFIIVGSALQAGCVDVAMLCVARLIIGLGQGFLLPSVPLYQAEIAPPHARGLMVGLHSSALGFGISLAQWMGAAFFYTNGSGPWRGPFGIQIAFPLALFLIAFALPESPRWLYAHGKTELAQATLIKLHKDGADPSNSFALHEFAIMKAQTDIELETTQSTWQALRVPSVRKRFILGFMSMFGTQCCGSLVLLSYSPTIYAGLGFSPFTSNIMVGAWGIVLGLGNALGALIVDKFGRRPMLMWGYALVVIGLIAETLLTKYYAGTDTAGSKAATFFLFWIIFVFAVGVEAPSFVYTAEIFPMELRAQGVAFGMQGLFISSVLSIAVAAPALTNIGYLFYVVFVCCAAAMFFVVMFFFPETKGYTLEQLSQVFGDEVVDGDGLRHTEHASDGSIQFEKGAEAAEQIEAI